MLGVRVPPGLPILPTLGLRATRIGSHRLRGADSMIGFLQKVKDSFLNVIEFIKDTRKELRNVSFPTRRELASTTVVVIICVFFFGAFLAVVDWCANRIMVFVLAKLSS
jgi:preprotein translocase SecE subunit